VGRKPGIYDDWNTASEQIKDWKGPKYKKFDTREEAEEFVKSGGKASKKPAAAKAVESGDDADAEDTANGDDGNEPSAKKVKIISSTPKDISRQKTLKVQSSSNSTGSGRVALKSRDYKASSKNGVLRVYTDGSSLGNGRLGAVAGVGVFFGEGDAR
jgi:ribonuclease HI